MWRVCSLYAKLLQLKGHCEHPIQLTGIIEQRFLCSEGGDLRYLLCDNFVFFILPVVTGFYKQLHLERLHVSCLIEQWSE